MRFLWQLTSAAKTGKKMRTAKNTTAFLEFPTFNEAPLFETYPIISFIKVPMTLGFVKISKSRPQKLYHKTLEASLKPLRLKKNSFKIQVQKSFFYL